MLLLTSFTVALSMLAGPGESGKTATDAFEAPPGRVSFVDGRVFLRGPFDRSDWPATENSIIREGDQIRTDGTTFAELEIGADAFIRLAQQSTVVIEEVRDRIVVVLVEGSAYVSRGEHDTPLMLLFAHDQGRRDGRFDLHPSSMGRVDLPRVRSHAPRRVYLAHGSGQLETAPVPTALAAGVVATSAGRRWHAKDWDPDRADDFDRWSIERERLIRDYQPPEQVAHAGYRGLHDLGGHGAWVDVGGGGMGWRPLVAPDWRPYRDGYWQWQEPYGWTWCSFAPWGWVTHHYGRWHHIDGVGWVWLPEPRWSPAWVAWGVFGHFIGWAPIDLMGRPVVVNIFHSHYDASAWVFASVGYFSRGGSHQAARVGSDRPHEPRLPFVTLTQERLRGIKAKAVLEPRIALQPASEGGDNLLTRLVRQPREADEGAATTAPVARFRRPRRASPAQINAAHTPATATASAPATFAPNPTVTVATPPTPTPQPAAVPAPSHRASSSPAPYTAPAAAPRVVIPRVVTPRSAPAPVATPAPRHRPRYTPRAPAPRPRVTHRAPQPRPRPTVHRVPAPRAARVSSPPPPRAKNKSQPVPQPQPQPRKKSKEKKSKRR